MFTLPEGLRPLALRNQRVVHNLSFKAVSETLMELTKDPKYLGAEIGFITILHTRSRTLIDHLYIHCIALGRGLSLDGKQWVSLRKGFFTPAKVLSRVFRGKFLTPRQNSLPVIRIVDKYCVDYLLLSKICSEGFHLFRWEVNGQIRVHRTGL